MKKFHTIILTSLILGVTNLGIACGQNGVCTRTVINNTLSKIKDVTSNTMIQPGKFLKVNVDCKLLRQQFAKATQTFSKNGLLLVNKFDSKGNLVTQFSGQFKPTSRVSCTCDGQEWVGKKYCIDCP